MDAGDLALIVRAGAGYNTIDVGAASARGIYVSNCPGKNAIAVAELAFGLILALDRRIPDNVAELRAGRWDKKEFSKAKGLHGRTLGLLGFGNIAQELARRAQAFGMDLVIWSRRFEDDLAVDLGDLRSRHVGPRVAGRRRRHTGRGRGSERHPERPRRPGSRDARARRRGRSSPGSGPARSSSTRRGPRSSTTTALADAVRERGLRVGLDVYPDEPTTGTAEFHVPLAPVARRLRDPPHRRLDRAGPGGDRRRDRPDRPLVQGDRAGPERREPRPPDAGDPPARRPPSEPAGRPGPRVRAPARRGHQRARDRERHLPRTPRPPSPGSTWTARCPTRSSLPSSAGDDNIISLQLVAL